MDKLVFERVNKNFGNVSALKDFSFSIKQHELIVVLGASGSGKTTLLRIIAGLEENYSGNIYLDEQPIETIDIKNRKVALMFQNYALYPQMNAYQNLTLPLKQAIFYKPLLNKKGQQVMHPDYEKVSDLKKQLSELKKDDNYKNQKHAIKSKIKELKNNPSIPVFSYQPLSKEEIQERIENILSVLDLESFLYQRVSTLSGGQKQRVALGKALIKQPDILLMDEPTSNLDAKIKGESRELIRKIHNISNATTIVVSHDQNDASGLADRVVILHEGQIEQTGTFDEIYESPVSVYAALSLGNPPINLIDCIYDGTRLKTINGDIEIPLAKNKHDFLCKYINKKIIFAIRAENIFINDNGKGIKVKFANTEVFGRELLHRLLLGSEEILIRNKEKINDKENLWISFNEDKIIFFDKDNENILN